VTHITFFPQQPYLHVVIDAYSKLIWAVPQHNEYVHAVIASLLQWFTVMGVPSKLKTDNGPAYTDCRFKQFCKEWNIVHVTGLPYNPQGQAIVEMAHKTLKTQLLKNKKRGNSLRYLSINTFHFKFLKFTSG
jgi:transposase InsO family protein